MFKTLAKILVACHLYITCFPYTPDFGRFCNSPLMTQHLSQFSREIVDLLKHSPGCRMAFSKFIPAYHHHFGRQCRVADYGYTKLMELFEAVPHVVQVQKVLSIKSHMLLYSMLYNLKNFEISIFLVTLSAVLKSD